MPLPALLRSFWTRLLDAAGMGARFSGGGAAAAALIASDGRLLSLSSPAGRLFAEAGRAKTLPDLFLGEDRADVETCVRSKATSRVEARARRPGGAAGHFEVMIERRADGRAVALLIDRTAEKRDAHRLRQEIDRARAEAAEGAAMLADLSHEMKTPLNAVIGFAETIERQTFGPVGHGNYAQYAEHIRMAGRHLLDLVNAALDLSKIEADRFALKRVAADPASIAKECAAIMKHAAEEAGLTLVADIAADLPESLLDPRAVKQILINLLSNAVKFTSDGYITLTARRDEDEIVFVVKDDGVGMSVEALQKIGSRYTRAHESGVRGQGGAGLGLALALSLAELHGGRVTLTSAPGEGLSAEVRLPIRPAPAPAKGVVRAMIAAARSDEKDAVLLATELDRIKARRARPKADAA